MSYKRTILLDTLILVCLTAALIKPLFRLKYLDNWASIESTYISEARMLGENLPHPGWQPLWYCGTRTDYLYPPAVFYGTMLISKVGHVLPVRAYHLYIAFFYVLGIAAIYWLVRTASNSRGAAWLAATATALVSPSLLLFKDVRHDSIFWVPQRLHVLMFWGEGPHISAVCVLPAALACAFAALRKGKPAALAGAGILSALVLATNFYGAIGLGILYPIVAWSVWNGERARGVLLRAVAIPVIAYGLSAFWLTPSDLRITLTDLGLGQNGVIPSAGWPIVLAIAVVLYCALSWRFTGGRSDREWRTFVSGAVFLLSLYVLGFHFGFRVRGEATRLIPELDLALILGGVELLRTFWQRPTWRIAAVSLALLAFAPSIRYLRHAWSPFPKSAPLENVFEYQTIKWVHDHVPGERVLATGSIRFWFDTWADNPQVDGGSYFALLNPTLEVAQWQLLHESRSDLAVLWLQALGTSAVVVPEKTSLEHYHDIVTPGKFKEAGLPLLHDDGQGTLVYQVPRVHPGLARVVDSAGIRMHPLTHGDDLDGLTKYVAAVEDPARPEATAIWRGFDEVDIQANSKPGESLLLQETWDPAWHAYENEKALPVRVEPAMDFMLIDVPEGAHNIQMRFETPLENRFGQVLFVITTLGLGIFIFYSRTSRLTSASARG